MMKACKFSARSSCLAAACAAVLSVAAQDVSEARLEQACAALQQSPLAAAELQTLLDVSRKTDYKPSLRSRAMAAYSLTLLMQGNTNAFDRAVQVLRATYPDVPALIKVTPAAAYSTCDVCAGAGVQTAFCPACRGLGKCKTCAATGQKDGAACPACKGKGTCAMCGGKKRIETLCATCKGTRQIFKPSAAIRENYNALLADIVAICQENVRFEEQFRQASRETDTAKRIELFKQLVQAFPKRTDLSPALNLLEKTVRERDARAAFQREREALAQQERELEELRKLKDAEDLTPAIATLNTYLKEHPKTPAYLELKTLMDELVAKRNRKQQTRNILYGVLGLFGFLFLFTCLKPFLFRRQPQGSGPLPGMDKINMADFTDPLSLNAKDSKSRVKTQTAEILPPDDTET